MKMEVKEGEVKRGEIIEGDLGRNLYDNDA